MSSDAKAASAVSTQGIGSSRSPFAGAVAFRGASSAFKGSGAPSSLRHALFTLCSAALLLLALSPAASAAVSPKGVTGFFGTTGSAAGQIKSPRGTAVKQEGTGAGNVYAVDGENNRVVVFDSNGVFLRAFGADVVASGPDQASEVQAIDVNATGGEFTLTFNGQTTSNLVATATAAQVQSALNALSTIGGLNPAGSVTVTGGPGNAGGTAPYKVTFAGSLAATNVSQITATNVGLTGGSPSAAVTTGTVNEGEVGFEICLPAGDTCKAGATSGNAITVGGAMSAPQGIAVNQTSGDVYVSDQGNRRVSQYDSNGSFIRTFGKDVVATGFPGDSPAASAVQTLTVTATSGKYKLKFGGKETAELPFNATFTEIQTALQGLASIGAGNVSVSGTGPYTITFSGALANNPEPLITTESGPGEPLVGGIATVVNTTTGSNELEICAAGGVCKAAAAANATAGGFGAAIGQLTVAPTGSANVGDVLVADATNMRVQEFTSAGAFVRAFGKDVVSAGPDSNAANFEICSLAAGDACKTGVNGTGNGEFATGTPTRVAESAAGTLYTVETAANFRVQKFAMPAPSSVAVTASGPFDTTDIPGTSAAAPSDVAIDPATSNVLVTRAFAAASTPSCPITGTASVAESRVLEISSGGTLEGTHGTCAGITLANGLAMRTSTAGGNVYVASGNATTSRIFVLNTGQPVAPTASITSVSGITAHAATISAFVNPNGPELPYGQETTYKFEFKLSSASTYTQIGSGETSAGNRTTNKLITQQLENLQAGSSYDVRLVATKPFGSGSATSTVTFSTASSAPLVAGEAVGSVTETGARLYAFVNPSGQNTNYHFEYGTTTSYGNQLPEFDLFAGNGSEPVQSTVKLSGLQEHTTYHYRVVASNSSGTTRGADQTFTTGITPANCPNAAIRAGQVSEELPGGTTGMIDCLALEMISPPVKGQKPVNLASLSSDGEHALFRTGAALAETESVDSLSGDFYVAQRDGGGWTTTPTILHRLVTLGTPVAYSSDFTSWIQIFSETQVQSAEGVDQAYLSRIDRSVVPISPLLDPLQTEGSTSLVSGNSFEGASTDMSHLYFQPPIPFGTFTGQPDRMLPEDPLPGGTASRSNVYVATFDGNGDPAPLQLLARDSVGKVWGLRCGARIGGDADLAIQAGQAGQRVRKQGAISADGSRVYFSTRSAQGEGTCATTNKMRILERLETGSGPQITELISNECTRISPACDLTNGDDNFQGASEDGTKVYFTTTRQLASSDLDTGTTCGTAIGSSTGCDLYLYDSTLPAGHRLTQVSAGDASNPTPGSGAKVLNSIAAISTDGSHVYFVAQSVLTTSPNKLGAVAQAGQPNLYLYEKDATYPSGRTAFVGKLDSGDSEFLWGKAQTFKNGAYPVPAEGPGGGTGQVLLFASKAQLAANDSDGSRRDIYRYDSVSGSLQCLSCLSGGDSEAFDVRFSPEGSGAVKPGPDMASRNRWTSEDGSSVVFSTAEPLLPSDANVAFDDYIWRDGQLQRLPKSSGYSSTLGDAPTISADGSTVEFLTAAALLPRSDGDTSFDVYAVRSGGGYPIPPVAEICEGEACQEPFQSQSSPSTSASESQTGENVHEAPVRPRCKKGFVRNKAGKCVRRHRQSKKRHKGKSHNKQRAGYARQGGSK